MRSSIENLLYFYGKLGRPLTFIQIAEVLGVREAEESIEAGEESGEIVQWNGFYTLKEFSPTFQKIYKEQSLLDKKWKKLLGLGRFFSYVPFIDFVLVGGSMALGNVSEKSDFDVLVGVRKGSIFTARYLALLIFSLLGARRLDDSEYSSPDKFCFNHFVTEETYSKPPYNYYRRELFRNSIPIYGDAGKIEKFLKENGVGIAGLKILDHRYLGSNKNLFAVILEKLFSGKLGDFVEEKIASPIAQKRLTKYLKSKKNNGRFRYYYLRFLLE